MHSSACIRSFYVDDHSLFHLCRLNLTSACSPAYESHWWIITVCVCVCWKKNRITGFLELWGCLSESQKSRWALKSLVHTPSLQTSCVYHESESACYVNPQRSEGDTGTPVPCQPAPVQVFFPSLLTQSSNYLLLPVIELWLILKELGPQSASMFYSCL